MSIACGRYVRRDAANRLRNPVQLSREVAHEEAPSIIAVWPNHHISVLESREGVAKLALAGTAGPTDSSQANGVACFRRFLALCEENVPVGLSEQVDAKERQRLLFAAAQPVPLLIIRQAPLERLSCEGPEAALDG